MNKNRYNMGLALDRLSQTFNRVHVNGLAVTVYDEGPGEHGTKVGAVGYLLDEPTRAYIDIVDPQELSRVKALTEYAEALEELAQPQPQFR